MLGNRREAMNALAMEIIFMVAEYVRHNTVVYVRKGVHYELKEVVVDE